LVGLQLQGLPMSYSENPYKVIASFFEIKEYSKLPVQISHGSQNEAKAHNAYTGFKVCCCGLVVNPSLP